MQAGTINLRAVIPLPQEWARARQGERGSRHGKGDDEVYFEKLLIMGSVNLVVFSSGQEDELA